MVPEGWETAPLSELADFLSGGTPSTQRTGYWGGEFPWVSAKDMKSFMLRDAELRLTEDGRKSGAKIAPIGSVLVLVRGMTLLKDLPVGYVERDVAFNQDIKALVPQNGLSGLYLAYALVASKEQILQLVNVAGHGTGRLDTTLLKGFIINVPPLPEQHKIAEILSTWDRAIDLGSQLIRSKQQRKRGLMEQLLTGRQRLTGFEGEEWQKKRLDQIFERVTRKNIIGNENVLTASGQRGLVSQIEYFNRSVAGASLENYYLIKRGEFAYNRSSSDGYPFGAIKRLEDYEAGILSTLYICFRLIDETSNSSFYKHFFEAGGLNRGIYSIAQEGARNHGLLNVGIDEFFSLDIPVPPSKEQNYLADLFDALDKDINLTIQKRDLLKQQKQGLMQQLLTGRIRVNVDPVEA